MLFTEWERTQLCFAKTETWDDQGKRSEKFRNLSGCLHHARQDEMQDNSKTIQQERLSLIKTIKNDRELRFESKTVSDRLLIAGEEKFSLGPFRNKTQVNFFFWELCFNSF